MKQKNYKPGTLVQDMGSNYWYRVTQEEFQRLLLVGKRKSLYYLYRNNWSASKEVHLENPLGVFMKKQTSTEGRNGGSFLLILHPTHGLIIRRTTGFSGLTKVLA